MNVVLNRSWYFAGSLHWPQRFVEISTGNARFKK